MSKILPALVLIFLPFFCYAADLRPGTDDFLIANGLTEEQLTANVATEEREAFISTTGESLISDPVGDVLSRTGTHPQLNYGWADLISAELKKDEANQCWSFNLKTAEGIPDSAPWQANFLLYIDHDADIANNAPEGVRINTDYEITVKYGAEDKETAPRWFSDLRWYNPEPNFWAVNKETASTFKFEGDQLNICVPFTEISPDVTPTWRAAAVGSDGQNTQIDVIPGAGFPPPKGETYPTWGEQSSSTNFGDLINWNALGVIGGIITLIILIKLIFWLIQKKGKPFNS